ncbi:tripartite tricarboxylate transporter TctB family protein [Pseudonocardia sp. MH-G8]|uniref:tripartite tricarboxylate transporter TctB family protein n=1 Tax=Pseudonocardia sp. MH-G8 TaxID=1854588 RepID=UPI0013043D27|nr:tripartite tricarboxylate transporter TctB family protein [Pseudonocardia sp. MH-G8]
MAATETSTTMDGVRRGRMIVGTVVLIAGLAYTVHAFSLPLGTMAQPGAALFPLIVGVATIVISILTIGEARFTTKVTGEVGRPAPGRTRVVLAMSGAIVGYLLLLPFIGPYLGAGLFGAVAVLLLRDGVRWKSVLYGAALGLLITYVFIELLGVRLAAGSLTGV